MGVFFPRPYPWKISPRLALVLRFGNTATYFLPQDLDSGAQRVWRIHWPQKPRPPGPTRDAAPAGEPVPGTEAAGLWRPTRDKGEPASTRRQASEGRSGGPGYVTVITVSST